MSPENLVTKAHSLTDSTVGTAGIRIQDTGMSARTPDSLFYEGERYAILRVAQHTGLFDPQQFGITPASLHTGAYRGFVCCYSVEDGTLLLSSLEIRAKDGLYPAINDSIPSFPDIELDDAE